MMKNKQKFNKDRFLEPELIHAGVYVWVWNDTCTREIIDAQLSEMQRLGIRAFYILPEPREFRPDSMPTNLSPDYLSAEFFSLCAYAVEQGGRRGMRCWLYDEGGWPSGGACGKVLRDHPEYARQNLQADERAFSAGDVYHPSSPDVLAAFLQDRERITDGFVFPADAVVAEYRIEKRIHGDADYPDLLNPDAAAYFLRITHEQYAASMKDALGQTVTAVFTDEPKAPGRAFNAALAERYEALYGTSVLPYLPLIAGRVQPTAENVQILSRWYDLCSRMFCAHFLLPCKEWANAHGLAFTGHMDKDHAPLGCMRGGGNFHLLRALRCLDIPGVDVIWRQLYPENRTAASDDMHAYNGFFPRYASSAAAQNGGKQAMAEIFGVAGPGLSYDVMRYTVGYLAVRGINLFNLFNFPLGRKGVHLAQELPIFTESQPYSRDLPQFNRYMERLSYICTLGERVCDTALYYPVLDFQGGLYAEAAAESFDALGRMLEERTVDFDIADDDAIQSATGAPDGMLCIGSAAYRHLVIPENATLPQDTQAVLHDFVRGGGSISSSLSDLMPVLSVEGDGLRVMHRRTESESIFCLFRQAGDNGSYRVHLPSHSGYLLHLENGAFHRFETENGVLPLSLAVGETAVILLTQDTLPAQPAFVPGNRFDLSAAFRFRKERELTCDENGFDSIRHSDASAPIHLGDWANQVGNAYSGSGMYETVFTLPAEAIGKAACLDLGQVCFTAAVCLNGCDLGTVLAPPYKFSIRSGVLRAENTLKITVTNTSANWYAHTDYFDRWDEKSLSPYFYTEKLYAEDAAFGGLYGPVSLYTENWQTV